MGLIRKLFGRLFALYSPSAPRAPAGLGPSGDDHGRDWGRSLNEFAETYAAQRALNRLKSGTPLYQVMTYGCRKVTWVSYDGGEVWERYQPPYHFWLGREG